jgi:cytochrome c-type biogenesis protein CcmH
MMLFWIVAGFLILACLVAVFRPLLLGSGRGARRASYDAQIYRDQLKEVEAERARGLLGEEEADATRIEVARRLLQAADAEAQETALGSAPRRITLVAGVGVALVISIAAVGLYSVMGVPGLPDQPLAERERRMAEARANRPGQDEAEAAMAARQAERPDEGPAIAPEDAALIERLREVLKDRPDDLQGHRLLARSLATIGRFAEARAAQEDVLAMLGETATAQDQFELAELMILAAGGYISPEAEALLTRGLQQAPDDPLGRYYSGLTLVQAGRPDLAYPLWARLLQESPPDAPWVAPIRAQIDDVARMAGLPPAPSTPDPAPGPSQADIAAAKDMSPEERQAMIEGMVEGLSDRLAAEGGPPADWARLIRALGVLGQADRALAIRAEARTKFAGDPAALAEIEAGARAGGLAP